ncbi:hypothetical protein [Actinokineospora sp.]|uniref:hypothetical protein n=1 Tax=Actinokineospora sp. TaxID=1872133 RepID=UPI003D6A2A3D
MHWGKCYDPHDHAELLGAEIIYSRAVRGFGDYRAGIIRLHPDLTQAEARCTTAHEIVHHQHRDDVLGYCGVAWLDTRLERRVHAIASRRLIIPVELADAVRWTDDPNDIAEQLIVDARTLHTRVLALTRDDYAELRTVANGVIRRSLADLRRHAARHLHQQQPGA